MEFNWQGISTITKGLYGARPTMFHKCYQCLKPCMMNIPAVIPQGIYEFRYGGLDHIMEFRWQGISAITIMWCDLKPTLIHEGCQHLKPYKANITVVIPQNTNELRYGSLDYVVEFNLQRISAIRMRQYGLKD